MELTVTDGGFTVDVTGEGADVVPRDDSHLILRSARRGLADLGYEAPGLRLRCHGTIPHGPALLADKRVHIVAADIVMAVAEATSTYDLVLLDVDNGPGQLVHGENARLYEPDFLTSTRQLLNRGGAVVVWSANPAPELRETMEDVFGNCTEQRHGVLLQGREEEYLLYLSRRT